MKQFPGSIALISDVVYFVAILSLSIHRCNASDKTDASEVEVDETYHQFPFSALVPLRRQDWIGWTLAYNQWMEKAAKKVRVIVLGGSGATGIKLIDTLLANDRVESVSNLGRRVYDALPKNPKLIQHVIDFENFPAALNDPKLLKQYDIAFMMHGTTRSQAGSADAFVHIDRDYAIEFAKLCKKSLGVETYVLLTSGGANADSWFLYPKTKGEIENESRKLEFKRFLIYRPGFLKREKDDRFWDKLFSNIPFIPTVDVKKLSTLMLDEALKSFDNLSSEPNIAAAKVQENIFSMVSL
jgi:oxidoreductase